VRQGRGRERGGRVGVVWAALTRPSVPRRRGRRLGAGAGAAAAAAVAAGGGGAGGGGGDVVGAVAVREGGVGLCEIRGARVGDG